MRKVFNLTIVFSLILFFTSLPEPQAEQELPMFQIITEDWIPYQFEKNGNLEGIAVDLLVLLLKRVGSRQSRKDIKMYPWARGYDILQSRENTILFSTTRTPERENVFKWVGPIFKNSTFLIGKKSKDIKIKTNKDLGKYEIGTIIDDASELYMVRLGLPLKQLQRNTSSINNLKKMNIDRIDLIVSGWYALKHDAEKLGINPDLFEKVYQIETADVSFAFNIKTSNQIIEKFQSALDEIKSEGALNKILFKYKNLMD